GGRTVEDDGVEAIGAARVPGDCAAEVALHEVGEVDRRVAGAARPTVSDVVAGDRWSAGAFELDPECPRAADGVVDHHDLLLAQRYAADRLVHAAANRVGIEEEPAAQRATARKVGKHAVVPGAGATAGAHRTGQLGGDHGDRCPGRGHRIEKAGADLTVANHQSVVRAIARVE